MKRHSSKKTTALFVLVVGAILFFAFGISKFKLSTNETQTCYGQPVIIQASPAEEFWINNNDPFPHECTDIWHNSGRKLSVSAPEGWHFSGTPFVHRKPDYAGWLDWNDDTENRMIITQNNSNYIEAIVFVGSKEVIINLGCEATKNK